MTLNTMHAYRFGMNFEETIVTVGKLTEAYQTVHFKLKELTDFPKKDQEDPTEVFTDSDIHFEKKSASVAHWHEAYHLSHGFYQ